MNPQDLNKPVALNLLIMPYVPEGQGTLLGANGKAVFVDYSKVNWKGLSESLSEELRAVAPASVKVYVGDDAFDLYDLHRMDSETGFKIEDSPNIYHSAFSAIEKLDVKGLRAGIIPLSKQDIHLNKELTERPPAVAIMVSVKFPNVMTFGDYFYNVQSFFGIDPQRMSNKEFDVVDLSNPPEMSSVMRSWLFESFKAVYDKHCVVMDLGFTRSA